MCNQFHHVNTKAPPSLTSKPFTLDRRDETRVMQVDGIIRHYDPLDIVSTQKRKYVKHGQFSNKLTNIVGG